MHVRRIWLPIHVDVTAVLIRRHSLVGRRKVMIYGGVDYKGSGMIV